jgi:S-adenosylmethionine:tRNA ribosyltransferase-isomerase
MDATVSCMNDPRQLSIKDFTYLLPEEKIAKFPLPERDDSRLLIYKDRNIIEDRYRNIARNIPANSLLILNETKVIEARLLFQKQTGAIIEIFCLEPHEEYADITSAMLQKGRVKWLCLIGGASKWKHGQLLVKEIFAKNSTILLTASLIEKRPDVFVIELSWTPTELSFAEIIHFAGQIPLPPYLKREVEKEDNERYQTVYAREPGSVAAPTAGLHFTDNIFGSLAEKGIELDHITLHVGAGTFKPVKAHKMEGHEMHAEWIDVSRNTISNILEHLNMVIAVGTTSLRTIESLYWLGIICGDSPMSTTDVMHLSQWAPYQIKTETTVEEALKGLLTWMDKVKMDRLVARTSLLIAPGYDFRIVKGLITNFHQPESTLLLLVAAFIGEDWRKLYQYALDNDLRFLSYGDGSLLWKN